MKLPSNNIGNIIELKFPNTKRIFNRSTEVVEHKYIFVFDENRNFFVGFFQAKIISRF